MPLAQNHINVLNRTVLTVTVINSLVMVIYFFIMLTHDEHDLAQMRRIILTGIIGLVSGLSLAIILVQIYLRTKPHMFSAITTLIILLIVGISFHYRLADAFRHAYASAFITYYTTPALAQKLGNTVEWVTSYKKDILFSTAMDQCNNRYGRETAQLIKNQNGSWQEVEQKIAQAYHSKELILSKHQHQDILKCYQQFFPQEKPALEMRQKIDDSTK